MAHFRRRGAALLALAGTMNVGTALVLLAVLIIEPRLWPAGIAESLLGSPQGSEPGLVGAFARILIFTLFGCYALSSAEMLPKLPYRRPVLVVVGLALIGRGMLFVPQFWLSLPKLTFGEAQGIAFSMAILSIAFVHAAGAFLWFRIGQSR